MCLEIQRLSIISPNVDMGSLGVSFFWRHIGPNTPYTVGSMEAENMLNKGSHGLTKHIVDLEGMVLLPSNLSVSCSGLDKC
jgi:hypothetical protein